METFNSRTEIETSQNYEEELIMIDQFLFHLPKIFMKSDDLASISSEENCPEENFNDCSDLENYVGYFESKKVPQDWDKELGLLESHMTKYHSVSMPKYLARSIHIQ